ncbi:MAG: DUF5655 domain-containing protein [Salibacteraceae bacterium]
MWTCPACERQFKTNNQSHTCTTKTLDDLFHDKPDHLVLAFDRVLNAVVHWEPNSVGVARHSVVFTNRKAWLIVKPMKKELDLKFYHHQPLEGDALRKVSFSMGKYVHHIRINDEHQVGPEVLELLRQGYQYAMN